MVTTRRRTRTSSQGSAASEQQKMSQDDEPTEEHHHEEQQPELLLESAADKEKTVTATASSSSRRKRNKKPTARELRKMQREQARAKELGLIVATDNPGDDSSNKPKKIVFDSDDEEEDVDVTKEGKEAQKLDASKPEQNEDDEDSAPEETVTSNNKENVQDDDEDEDDAVEQMDSRVAKDMALKERKRERETKAVAMKRKRKSRPKTKGNNDATNDNKKEKDDEGELLPEDFFAELDAHKSSLSQAKKQKKKNAPDEVERKHTIFQTSHDELGPHPSRPIEVNPGMELVILEHDKHYNDNHAGDNAHAMALNGDDDDEEPSETAMVHSRGQIVDGSDIVSHKQKQKHRKHGLKPPEANWKRSKKMNRLLLSKGKEGKAAPTFVVKSYKF